MRTREKILLLLLSVTLALGALVYSKLRRDDASLLRFRWFVLNHPMRNISNALTWVVQTSSDSDNRAILWYGGLSLFGIVMVGMAFKSVSNAEARVFRDRLVEAQVAKAEAESLLQDSLWKEKNARAARETALEELEASASRILALEDRLTANERLLKRQEAELKTLRSQHAVVTERPLETLSTQTSEQSALRNELQKMAALLQEKDSAAKQLENTFRDRMGVVETQLDVKEKLLGERDRELETLRARLAKAAAAKRDTEILLAQQVTNNKQALQAKDTALQELEQALTAKISALEIRLSDHLELLQSRSTELDAARSEANLLAAQLADVTSAKARADHRLQQALKQKAELLESKDAAFKELQQSSEATAQALEGQLRSREQLNKEQYLELAALQARLSEVGAAKNDTERFLAEELKKEKQAREAKENALKELERNLTTRTHALTIQLREKEELLQNRSTELDAARSEATLLTAQLADVTSAKERADHRLQQELKQKAELLESKDAAFKELQTNQTATVSHLENQIREKDALLQSRNAELGAATAQLNNLELSRGQMEARLREELSETAETLQAKNLALAELENSSAELTAALKKEISEQKRLLQRRDEELEALRSDLNALTAQSKNTDVAGAPAPSLNQAIENEPTNAWAESAKKFATLETSLRDKEDLLKTREEKIARLESELKEKRTELAKHEISVWQAYERRALWKQRLAKFGISIKD